MDQKQYLVLRVLLSHGAFTEVWGAFIGPLVSVVSFVCSVGNVPLAAVLWNGGISFAGVIAFIFADLIIIPILDIYRRYYGPRVAAYLGIVSYVTMALAGLAISGIFHLFGAVPAHRHVAVFSSHFEWNYTTYLNIVFLALAGLLGWRFLRTGGIAMLKEMEVAPDETQIRDPVCGMVVDPASSTNTATFGGRQYWFCSAGCREAFEKDPEAYVTSASESTRDTSPGSSPIELSS